MTSMSRQKLLPILLFSFFLTETSPAASADARLLSLVPPGAQLVAGVSAPPTRGQPNSFLLLTQNNSLDFEDFLALTGADYTSKIHQVVFVAFSRGKEQDEHGILVSGHFDRSHVFRSAINGGATEKTYRQISVLEIQPFARERAELKGIRWLAILDADVLIFGSIVATQIEIDRYLARSEADESMLHRLALLGGKDQTWCLLSATSRTLPSLTRGHQIQNVLSELSIELAELAQSGNEVEFGFHYDRKVEFDYAIGVDSDGSVPDGGQPTGRLRNKPPIGFSLLPALNPERNKTLQGVISISMSRYKSWLASIKDGRIPAD